jgi:hypothetical protein
MNDLIVAGGVGAIALMQGIILAKLNRIDALSERVTQLDMWAFGPQRQNGKNKEINDLRTDVDGLSTDVAELYGERRSGDDRRRA